MATRDQQRHERRHSIGVFEGRGEEMGLHVMDGHEWLPQTESGSLRPANTDQEGPYEAGPRSDCHGIDIAQAAPRLRQRPIDHIVDALTAGGASAALAASIFHFGRISIPEVRAALRARGVPRR